MFLLIFLCLAFQDAFESYLCALAKELLFSDQLDCILSRPCFLPRTVCCDDDFWLPQGQELPRMCPILSCILEVQLWFSSKILRRSWIFNTGKAGLCFQPAFRPVWAHLFVCTTQRLAMFLNSFHWPLRRENIFLFNKCLFPDSHESQHFLPSEYIYIFLTTARC